MQAWAPGQASSRSAGRPPDVTQLNGYKLAGIDASHLAGNQHVGPLHLDLNLTLSQHSEAEPDGSSHSRVQHLQLAPFNFCSPGRPGFVPRPLAPEEPQLPLKLAGCASDQELDSMSSQSDFDKQPSDDNVHWHQYKRPKGLSSLDLDVICSM